MVPPVECQNRWATGRLDDSKGTQGEAEAEEVKDSEGQLDRQDIVGTESLL